MVEWGLSSYQALHIEPISPCHSSIANNDKVYITHMHPYTYPDVLWMIQTYAENDFLFKRFVQSCRVEIACTNNNLLYIKSNGK